MKWRANDAMPPQIMHPSERQRPRPPNGRRWLGKVKRIHELGSSKAALWRRLSKRCPGLRSPFFSLEFARAVAQSGARTRVWDRLLAGFFPFQFANRFTEIMAAGERIGGALNDFSGVIIDSSKQGSIGTSDLFVEIAKHYYSVPHQLIRQEVEARITIATIEIFH